MSDVICFANRDFGARLVRDLRRRIGIRLVAVVSNDPPDVDLDLDEASLGVSVLTWNESSQGQGQRWLLTEGFRRSFTIEYQRGYCLDFRRGR